TTMAAAAAPAPASNETRPPHTRRLSRSRPNSSVPRAWPAVSGGRRRFGVSTVSGSGSGRYGAASAARTTSNMVTNAAAASRLLRRVRGSAEAASLIADARVEIGVEDVDGKVDQDERERDDEDRALYERNVTRENALHDERTHAGPCEDRLGEHRPAQQIARLHTAHGHDRHQRLLQRVAH